MEIRRFKDEDGYHYKNGITTPDEKHLIRLEKFREIG